MPDVTLFGFPRSVYVQMAGIVLTHKDASRLRITFTPLPTTSAASTRHPVSASELDAHVDGAKLASLLVQIDQLYDQALLIMGMLIDCGQRGAAQRRRY
jgi:hypothetical protein